MTGPRACSVLKVVYNPLQMPDIGGLLLPETLLRESILLSLLPLLITCWERVCRCLELPSRRRHTFTREYTEAWDGEGKGSQPRVPRDRSFLAIRN